MLRDNVEIGVDWAFDRYEQLRDRLPNAAFPSSAREAANLAEVAGQFDGFVLDAFGVLNYGETPIAGAPERIAALRAMGKKLVVLTNAASYTRAGILAKYQRLGFDFAPEEVVSSRDLAFAQLAKFNVDGPWAAAAMPDDTFEDSPCALYHLQDDPSLYDRAGGFVLLSSGRWRDGDTSRLIEALQRHPRPLVVANPDLVAPRETGLTVEPGTVGHAVWDATGIRPWFFGKPQTAAFEVALSRLGDLPPARVAMVGDTLHTDVLGGKAAGLGTVLVTNHGLFKGRDVQGFVARSGICPDVIVPTT